MTEPEHGIPAMQRFMREHPLKPEAERAYYEIPDDYTSEDCPYCGMPVYGTPQDIDSGLRHHMEYCPERGDESED